MRGRVQRLHKYMCAKVLGRALKAEKIFIGRRAGSPEGAVARGRGDTRAGGGAGLRGDGSAASTAAARRRGYEDAERHPATDGTRRRSGLGWRD